MLKTKGLGMLSFQVMTRTRNDVNGYEPWTQTRAMNFVRSENGGGNPMTCKRLPINAESNRSGPQPSASFYNITVDHT